MPIGKPGEDGDIIAASRHYGGKPAPLGLATIWDCPACGKKNEGRLPEVGCGHCGAGDPLKSRGGLPQVKGKAAATPPRRTRLPEPEPPSDVRPATPQELHQIKAAMPPTTKRVLRLIEYLVKPGHNANDTLRRSLVGTMDLAWGSITATIVDSIDTNQEDRLRLAHQQPGVWISNPTVTEQQEAQARTADLQGIGTPTPDWVKREVQRMTPPAPPDPPDTGPAFSHEQVMTAGILLARGGYRLCYTLALALQGISHEVDMDPERFLSGEECLQLANALLAQIPPEWQADQAPAPTEVTAQDAAESQAALDRIRAGAVPKATFREPPPTPKGV